MSFHCVVNSPFHIYFLFFLDIRKKISFKISHEINFPEFFLNFFCAPFVAIQNVMNCILDNSFVYLLLNVLVWWFAVYIIVWWDITENYYFNCLSQICNIMFAFYSKIHNFNDFTKYDELFFRKILFVYI